MRAVLVAVSFLACLVALAVAAWFLAAVIGGAVMDAKLLAGVSGWLLLVYPAYWAGAWVLGRR